MWTPDDNSETTMALRQGLMRKSEDREEMWSGGGDRKRRGKVRRPDAKTYLYRVGRGCTAQQVYCLMVLVKRNGELDVRRLLRG